LACVGCAYDLTACSTCGDGVRTGVEPCDGKDFGGDTCVEHGFQWGTLACGADCEADTSGCVSPEYDPTAVAFDGVDDVIDCGNLPLGLPLAEYTWEAWIFPEPDQDGGVVFQKADFTWLAPGLVGGTVTEGTIAAFFFDGAAECPPGGLCLDIERHVDGSTYEGGSFPMAALGQWHHFALTARAVSGPDTEVCGYLDGDPLLPCATSGFVTNLQASADPVLMGRGPVGGPFVCAFTGLIDEIRLWSYAKAPYEIAEGMRTTLTGSEIGLVAYWAFDEGSGQATAEMVSGVPCLFGATGGEDGDDPTWTTETPF
jgi:hypothetical protein